MTNTNTTDRAEHSVLDDLRGTRDALCIQRVFGDPHTADGVTVIPVARIAGCAAGGGGEGTSPDDTGGSGFGTLFGLGARGIGVYEIRNGNLKWRPAIDADRLIRGGQVLAAMALGCTTLVFLRRHH